MSSKTALVLRATGSQGKALVEHLAKSGWNIHALVSDPKSDRAVALKKFGIGVHLFQGALGDHGSIEAAIKGCDAVFLNQMPSWTDDSETVDARAVLDLAKAAKVKHIVHTSQAGLNDPDLISKWSVSPIILPAVTGKIAVEQMVRESGILWTILRPGWFNTNILSPIVDTMYPGLSEGKFVSSYKPDTVFAAVDPDDIGAFAAAVLNSPDKFSGRHVTIASEKITVAEILAEIERATGKKLDIHYRTPEETEKEKDNPYVIGQTVTIGLDEWVDMDEIKSYGIPLTNFRKFLDKNKDAVVPK